MPQSGEQSIATHVETLERCRQAASQPARCISPHCPADWLGHRYIRFATLQAPGVLVPCRGTTSPTRIPAQCPCSRGTWQASGKKSPPTRGRTAALANQWHKLTAARPGPRSPGTIPTCSANGLLSISGQRLDLAVRHGAHHGFGSKCGSVQCNGSAAKWCGTRLWGRAERCCNPGRPV